MKKLWKQIASIMLAGALLISSAPLAGASIPKEKKSVPMGTTKITIKPSDDQNTIDISDNSYPAEAESGDYPNHKAYPAEGEDYPYDDVYPSENEDYPYDDDYPSNTNDFPNENNDFDEDTPSSYWKIIFEGAPNPAEDLDFSDLISGVTDLESAKTAIQMGISRMTTEQKDCPTGIDKITLFAEEAAARANRRTLESGSLNMINGDYPAGTRTALDAAESVLNHNGIQTQREPREILAYDAGDNQTVSIQNDAVSSGIDQVRMDTNYGSMTVDASQQNHVTTTWIDNRTVEVQFHTSSEHLVTVSFEGISAADKYMAVLDENGDPVGGKYNPAKGTLDVKLTTSGIYRAVNNEKTFADVKSQSIAIQNDIKLLASKGIIRGTSETTFSPDSTISRAEIAALVMRTLGKLDPNADGGFNDVTMANWYCGAAGSARKHNIVSGYPDNTFRGTEVISKTQIVVVASRALRNYMDYKTISQSEIDDGLSVYQDRANLAGGWAQDDVAFATSRNLVLRSMDGNFGGAANMTRGNAAIIIKRLFDKVW